MARACSLACASSRLVAPTRAMPTRSLPSRNLRVVPARFSSPMRFSAGTHVFEEDLVDLEAAVDQLDRAERDAGGVHREDQHRDAALLLLRGRVGAAQAEDPVGVLAERRPGLLAVDHPVVAVAHRGRAQRGEVGAGVGLGEAWHHQMSRLAVFGRKRSFCSWLPKAAMTGPIMLVLKASGSGTERPSPPPDVALQRRPVLAAPLHRPVRHGEPGGVERSAGPGRSRPCRVHGGRDSVADLLRHLGGEEGPHLLPEGLELRGTGCNRIGPHS